MIDQFWVTIFERERYSMAEAFKYRVSISTRLVRELVRLKGLVQDDQLMMDSIILQKYWQMPITYLSPHPTGPQVIRRAVIPVCPPPTRSFADPMFLKWIDVMHTIAARIGAYSSEVGLKGIFKLLDPPFVRSIFPDPEEIMAFEMCQVERTLHTQIDGGVLKAMEELQEKGYSTEEARRELHLARSLAPSLTSSSMEQNKSIMILRIENLLQRAKATIDIRLELQALKLLTFVQGLHKASGEDMMDELIKVMQQTGKKFDTHKQVTIDTEGRVLDEPAENPESDN